METTKPFYDLCLQEECIKEELDILNKYTKFGYKTVAINKVINLCKENSIPIKDKKKKLKKSNINTDDVLPQPIQITHENHELTILHRITVVFNEKGELCQLMKSPNFKKYDIIALLPKTQDALYAVCDVDVDIVCFDPIEPNLTKYQRKWYNKVVEKGVYFEIKYCPALLDQNARRNTITQTHKYHQIGKSRNVIISSGTNSSLLLRGPYEIINLGLIFGLSEQKSKNAIAANCANVINHALGRRIGKAIVFINSVEEVEPLQKKSKTVTSDFIPL